MLRSCGRILFSSLIYEQCINRNAEGLSSNVKLHVALYIKL